MRFSEQGVLYRMYDTLKPMAMLTALGLAASAAAAHKPDTAGQNDRPSARVEVQVRDDGFVIASTSQFDMSARPVAAVQLGAATRIDTAILLGSRAMDDATPQEVQP